MQIRQNNNAIRITFADTTKPTYVPYVLIDPTECWFTTFNAWGKKTDTAVITIGAKRYRVALEEIS
jgi:hypothetical protein